MYTLLYSSLTFSLTIFPCSDQLTIITTTYYYYYHITASQSVEKFYSNKLMIPNVALWPNQEENLAQMSH